MCIIITDVKIGRGFNTAIHYDLQVVGYFRFLLTLDEVFDNREEKVDKPCRRGPIGSITLAD